MPRGAPEGAPVIRQSNVQFLRPYDEVVDTWRRCIAHAYDPERLFARFAHQVDATYANRMDVPARGKLTVRNLREAVVLGFNIVLWIGLRADLQKKPISPTTVRVVIRRMRMI